MLFQGEEYAASTPFQYFADHEDPEMAKAVSAGRKKEFAAFGWDEDVIPDPEDRATFERSKLRWEEVEQGRHGEMLEWFKRLIRLRRSSSSLNDGELQHIAVRYDADSRWLAMDRGQVRVLANLGPQPVAFEVPAGYRLELCSRDGLAVAGERISLPSDTLAVLSMEAVEN
jgi:maltooligosyltrehalose trehalohydrolase